MPAVLEITVAICFDSFDPSTFLSIVFNSAYHAAALHHRIILVPSFNTSTKFVELLRDLSFLTKCTVIYVNSLHGDARTFIGGIAIRDIVNRSGASVIDQLKAEHEKVFQERKNEQGQIGDEVKSEEAGKRIDELRRREGALLQLLM